jgi:hypothetical protein
MKNKLLEAIENWIMCEHYFRFQLNYDKVKITRMDGQNIYIASEEQLRKAATGETDLIKAYNKVRKSRNKKQRIKVKNGKRVIKRKKIK